MLKLNKSQVGISLVYQLLPLSSPEFQRLKGEGSGRSLSSCVAQNSYRDLIRAISAGGLPFICVLGEYGSKCAGLGLRWGRSGTRTRTAVQAGHEPGSVFEGLHGGAGAPGAHGKEGGGGYIATVGWKGMIGTG